MVRFLITISVIAVDELFRFLILLFILLYFILLGGASCISFGKLQQVNHLSTGPTLGSFEPLYCVVRFYFMKFCSLFFPFFLLSSA